MARHIPPQGSLDVVFARDPVMDASPPHDPAMILRRLQRLTERLGAPDLTAAESRTLQPELLRLLEMIDLLDNPRPRKAAGRVRA